MRVFWELGAEEDIWDYEEQTCASIKMNEELHDLYFLPVIIRMIK